MVWVTLKTLRCNQWATLGCFWVLWKIERHLTLGADSVIPNFQNFWFHKLHMNHSLLVCLVFLLCEIPESNGIVRMMNYGMFGRFQQDISLEHPISTRVVRPKESEFLISLSLISYKELKGPQRYYYYLVWFPNKIWMLASQKWQFWQFISQFSKNKYQKNGKGIWTANKV